VVTVATVATVVQIFVILSVTFIVSLSFSRLSLSNFGCKFAITTLTFGQGAPNQYGTDIRLSLLSAAERRSSEFENMCGFSEPEFHTYALKSFVSPPENVTIKNLSIVKLIKKVEENR
jgi:hypothetical protein